MGCSIGRISFRDTFRDTVFLSVRNPVSIGQVRPYSIPVSAPEFDGLMQVFLRSAPPKMPALCGHFCFFRFLLLADQATFSPASGPSEQSAVFHFQLYGFQDNG